MALSPRLEVRQHQLLVMTPQMQQSVKLLQMSRVDPADYVAARVAETPLLASVPRPAPPAVSPPAPLRPAADAPAPAPP